MWLFSIKQVVHPCEEGSCEGVAGDKFGYDSVGECSCVAPGTDSHADTAVRVMLEILAVEFNNFQPVKLVIITVFFNEFRC